MALNYTPSIPAPLGPWTDRFMFGSCCVSDGDEVTAERGSLNIHREALDHNRGPGPWADLFIVDADFDHDDRVQSPTMDSGKDGGPGQQNS